MDRRLRSALSFKAVLLAGLVASAQDPPTPKPPAAVKPSSQSARIKALPDEERQWLTEFVAAIILDEEKKAFLDLAAGYQREIFKEDFWQRREQPGLPIPLGPGYRYRYQDFWQLANDRYDGWRADAGRMVLRWGEPAAILKPSCGGQDVLRDVEVWTYTNAGPNGRSTIRYIFYRPYPAGPRRLWTLIDSEEHAFYPNSCGRQSFRSLRSDCSVNSADPCFRCDGRCEVYKAYLEIVARQNGRAGGAIEMATVFQPPSVSTEGLDRQKDRWATTSDPKAKKIGVEGPSTSAPQDASSATTPSSTPTPEPRRKLSPEEIRDRIVRLEPSYRSWLDIAGPLLTEEDLSRFLQLSAGEKDQFIREFWKRRS
jgi:GWxTD domain-containing protein